jgi:acyl carrier protein
MNSQLSEKIIPDTQTITKKIRQFIFLHFLPGVGEEELKNADLLFEDGIIDSAGAITLIQLIEEHYEIDVMDEEMLPENFASINHIALFIEKKLNETG